MNKHEVAHLLQDHVWDKHGRANSMLWYFYQIPALNFASKVHNLKHALNTIMY